MGQQPVALEEYCAELNSREAWIGSLAATIYSNIVENCIKHHTMNEPINQSIILKGIKGQECMVTV